VHNKRNRKQRIGAPYKIKGKENRKQRIRISTYQKSCIVEYTVSDRLKFLFSLFSVSFIALHELLKLIVSATKKIM